VDFHSVIADELNQAAKVLNDFVSDPKNIDYIEQAGKVISASVAAGGKVISCGNGGSHCDAMHFAEELTGRYRNDRRAIPAICISDVSHITCVANDYGFEFVFSRYIDALGNNGDVLFVLSTSGNSPNILRAVLSAREKGMKIIALTGKDGGKLGPLVDIELRVPHFGFADRIQEVHIKIIHVLILLIEKQLA